MNSDSVKDFKPKWIKWDEDAHRADRQVQRMTPLQRALYRNLIIESYYNELRPYLPDDDSRLWELADAESLEQWLANKAPILAKFKKVTAEDGEELLINKRVMEEWADLEASLAQKKNASAKGVAARRDRAVTGRSSDGNRPVNPKSPQTPLEPESEQEPEEELEREREVELERSPDGDRAVTARSADVFSLSSSTNHFIGQDHLVSERGLRLAALVIKTAVGIDKNAVIYEGKRKNLERLLDGSTFTEDEIRRFTEETINALDSFGLKNAGGVLCATLTARIEEMCEALAEQQSQQEEMARTRAEFAAHPVLDGVEAPEDALNEWELPEAN